MLIDTSTIADLRNAFSGIYQDAYSTTASWGREVATYVPSSTKSATYGWMQQLPKMREWVGPRILNNLAASSYVIDNKPYELSVGVDRDDIEDDNLGVYNPLMAEMGRASRKIEDELIATLIQAGTTALCHDGAAFFASHTMAGTSYSNNATSTALTAANYGTRRGVMGTYAGESGVSLGVRPNLLIVPPQLEFTARSIVEAERDSSGATNIYRGTAQVLVIPELSSAATTWYLADTTRAIKPIVFQTRKAPEFVSKDSSTDDNVFFNRQYVFGVDARFGVGFGLWFLMSRQIT